MSRAVFFILLAQASVRRLREPLQAPAPPSAPGTIIVFPQISRIGDLVCATPVLKNLRATYPSNRIVVVMSNKKPAWRLLLDHPSVDKIVFYESPDLVSRLRAEHATHGLALTSYPIPSAIMCAAGIPVRVKTSVVPSSVSEKLSDWLNTALIRYEHHTSLPGHYLKFLAHVGVEHPSPEKEVVITPAGRAWADTFLAGEGITRPLIGISVSAGNRVKEWPEERFALLADRLLERYPTSSVLLLGAPNESARLTATLAGMTHADRARIVDHCPVEHLPSLVERLSLFVAVDTGLIYIAHALKIPLVDIVGPCDPNEQPPSDDRSICILPNGHAPSSFVMRAPGSYEERRAAVLSISVDDAMAGVAELDRRGHLSL